ncbi:MAG: DUF3330 domain-containing protein [Gammaproteobacteria bacterium]|jgi:hypothetical protein|uniref:DUF3330 domain-containing protein n=1 Tax=Thiobacillus sp. TaxID=924 RepID=UPI0025CFBC69|nr:DUF3330 domain-containing protein [Thiobacillus sp.]
METPPRTPAGAPVATCSDDAVCTVLTCAVCLVEVPPDSINLADAQDYVHHFCGLDCLDQWRRRAEQRSEPPGEPKGDRLK